MIWVIAWLFCIAALAATGAAEDPAVKVQNVKAGSDVILICDTGPTFDMIDWRINNSKSAFFIKFMNFVPFVATKFARRLHVLNKTAILISSVTGQDSGRYRCATMSTSAGDTTGLFKLGTPIDLQIQVAPFFLKQPLDRITAVEGTSVTLECHFEPRTKPEIDWERLEGVLPLERVKLSRGAHSSLIITRVATTDAGRYKCNAANDYGSIYHEFDVVVQRLSSAFPSQSKKATEGKLAVLDCQTGTSLPTTNVLYSWTKDGTDITSTPNPRISILVSGSLFLRGIVRSDSGVYRCTAKTFDQTGSGIVNYPGLDIFLDVQFPPSIIVIMDIVTVGEGTDARLQCISEGNPATEVTKWTRAGADLSTKPRFVVLKKGTLLIRKVKRSDMGTYVCTPSNSIGPGKPRTTNLIIQVVPKFTEVPPSVVTVRIGEDVSFKCSAVSETVPTVHWQRVGKPMPNRTKTDNGSLSIKGVRRDDHGEYECIAVTKKGRAVHTTTVTVIAAPAKPKITAVQIIYTTATVTWSAGYDGGYAQRFQIWYRKSTDSDNQWKNTPLLFSGTLSREIPGLEENTRYYFAVRGVNREGAGEFSVVLGAEAGFATLIPAKPLEPLPPTDVVVNITSAGYVLSWKHDPMPGRPSVEKFVVQYRKRNSSAGWITADSSISGAERMYILMAEHVDSNTEYEFRVFAYGDSRNSRSQPAYVSKTYHIATPVVAKRMANDDVIPIVAGVLGTIAFLVLVGLLCFCLVQFIAKKKGKDKNTSNEVHFVLPDAGKQMAMC